MSTNNPLNATQSLPDSPLEATVSPSIPSKAIPDHAKDKPLPSPSDGFPPSPLSGINVSGSDDAKKGKAKRRKGKRKGLKAGKRLSTKPLPILTSPDNKSQSLSFLDTATQSQPQVGEEGVGGPGQDGIGLHPVTNKNVDQKEPVVETEPVEGVEDVLKEDGIEEVVTRAEGYAKIRCVWEAAGDVCVRVYARPLNPRLILVEWEGEDGVEKHGRIVVNERQRGMFGPGKVVWVRGPLVGDKWLLAGKYNFLGNRVS